MKLHSIKSMLTGKALIVGSAATLLGMALAPAGQAAASGNHLCLTQAPSKCIVTHGAGNQITTDGSNYANTTATASGMYNQWVVYTIADGNGNCLEQSGTAVIVVGSGCNGNNNYERWAFEGGNNPPFSFQNMGSGNFMGTYGVTDGKPVWVHPKATGFYTGWSQE